MYVFIIEIYLFKENHLLSVEKLGIDFVERRKLEIEYVDGVYWYFVNRINSLSVIDIEMSAGNCLVRLTLLILI